MSGMGGMGGTSGVSTSGDVPGVAKEALVAQIKAYQKMGDEQKSAWWKYCDTQLNGIRDPARHDTNTLLRFALSIVDESGGDAAEGAEEQPAAGTASARWRRHTEAAQTAPVIDVEAVGTY